MQMLKRFAQIGTVSLMFSCGLAAQLTSGPYSTSTVTTELDFFGEGGVGTPYTNLEYLAFPLFDPALGTITGISISLTATLGVNNDSASTVGNLPISDFSGDGSNSEFYVYNASTSGTVTETANMQVYLMDSGGVLAPGGTTCLDTITSAGAETAPAASGCFIGQLPGLSYSNTVAAVPSTVYPNVINGLSTSGTLSDSDFSEFYGPSGTVYLPLYIEGSTHVATDNGDIDSGATLNAGVTATLTYTYEDLSAPEPASMVLMGLALTAIGVVRRRKSRS